MIFASIIGGTTAIIIGLFILFFHEFILGLFGQAYLASANVMLMIVVGHVVASVMGPADILLLMTGNQRAMVVLLAFILIVNVILNLLFIPIFGSLGAAIATSISAVLLAGTSTIMVMLFHKISPLRWNKSKIFLRT